MTSGIECPKCGYVRGQNELSPDNECPSCGIIYSKFNPSAGLNTSQPLLASGSEDRNSLQSTRKSSLPISFLVMIAAFFAVAGIYMLIVRGGSGGDADKLPYDISGVWIGQFEDVVKDQGLFTCEFEVKIDDSNRVFSIYWTEFRNIHRHIEGYWERPGIMELIFTKSDSYAGKIRSIWGRNADILYFDYASERMGAFSIYAEQALNRDQQSKLLQTGEFFYKKDENVLAATVETIFLDRGEFLLAPGALKSLIMPRMEVSKSMAGLDRLPHNVTSSFKITKDILGINHYPHRLYNHLKISFSLLKARVDFDFGDEAPRLLSFNKDALVKIDSDGFRRRIQINFYKDGRKTAMVNQKSAGDKYPLVFDLEKKE